MKGREKNQLSLSQANADPSLAQLGFSQQYI